LCSIGVRGRDERDVSGGFVAAGKRNGEKRLVEEDKRRTRTNRSITGSGYLRFVGEKRG